MRWQQVSFFLVASALAGTAQAATPEEAFTTRVRDKVHAADGTLTITVTDALTLEVTPNGGKPVTMNLGRAFLACQQQPKECDRAVEDLVSGTLEVLRHRDEAGKAEQLRAVVRRTDYLVQAEAQTGGRHVARAPIAGDLSLALVFDLPRGVRYANDHDLERLRLTFAQACAAALEHTSAELGPLDAALRGPKSDDGLGLIVTGSFYETSRILQTAMWAKAQTAQGVPLLVAVPGEDIVLWMADKPGALAVVRAGIQVVRERTPRPLSTQVMRLKGDHWEVVP